MAKQKVQQFVSKLKPNAGFWKLADSLKLEHVYVVFVPIYILCAVLFRGQGQLPEALLAWFTIVMILVSVLMLVKFVIYAAKLANEGEGKYGSLLVAYLVDALLPMLMLKLYLYVGWLLLPSTHEGWVCVVTDFIRDLYRLFNFQHSLDVLIVVTAAVVGLVGILAIGILPVRRK